ncbi:MAG: ABC transporter ATP-binding protein [Elainellaceae cyanobacterium]
MAEPPAASPIPNRLTAPVIQTHALQKAYRTGFWLTQKRQTLRHCSLQIAAGETFGLLGPNGAGKTTLLKILLGITRPTAGRGTLLGAPLGDRPTKQRIGYLPENPYFYDFLTGWEFLRYAAGLFQIPRVVQQQRIVDLLQDVGLDPHVARKTPMRQYSKGMLQRVGMAQALINDPDVVFLDEPMSGLDPLGRYQMRSLIVSLKARGKTVFFNSHVLSDVEQICDRVGILLDGELVRCGTVAELLGAEHRYRVVLQGGDEAALQQISSLEISSSSTQAGRWRGTTSTPPQAWIAQLPEGVRVVEVALARPTLEEFFIEQLQQRGYKA